MILRVVPYMHTKTYLPICPAQLEHHHLGNASSIHAPFCERCLYWSVLALVACFKRLLKNAQGILIITHPKTNMEPKEGVLVQ